ncbi:MAG TPA: DNA gyrase subunit A, partial [Candidatus Portnoybacteria bacterium]|nr:DNA gyrase subunit A [Candidatus Portnoybacteria bacterium]
GQALANFLQLSPEEKVTALVALAKTAKEGFLTMATKNGIIKKTEVSQFEQVRRSGLVALKLRKNDELKWVALTSGQDEIILATRFGQAIRFKEKDVRPMGRAAAGVSGIRLKKDDQVVRMNIVEAGQKPEERSLLVVTENGYGKRALLKFYKIQKRGGSGIKTARVTKRTGQVVSLKIISPAEEKEDLVVVSQKGQVIRIPLLSIPKMGRATQGVRIMRLGEGDMVASATRI